MIIYHYFMMCLSGEHNTVVSAFAQTCLDWQEQMLSLRDVVELRKADIDELAYNMHCEIERLSKTQVCF